MPDVVVLLDDKPVLVQLVGAPGPVSADAAAAAAGIALGAQGAAEVAQDGSEAAAALALGAASNATDSANDANASRGLAELARLAAEAAEDGAEAAQAGTIAAVAGASLSSVTLNAASRAVLAALDHTLGLPAYLTEAGREGMFKWLAGDQSAKVSIDPEQALFVPTSADATGASGVWMRILERGRCLVTWWGCVPGIGDVGAKAQAGLLTLSNLTLSGYGYGEGSYLLAFPASPYGSYNMGSHTLDIVHGLIIEGDNSGGVSGGSSVLAWNDGVTGFRVQHQESTGATGGDGTATPNPKAGYATLRGMLLIGGYAGTESESHAIHLRGKARIEDVSGYNWAGDFIHSHANGGSTVVRGNTNGSVIVNCWAQDCRNYASLYNSDSNTHLFIQPQMSGMREWGIKSVDNLGFNVIGGDFTACGQGVVGGVHSYCSYDGGSGRKWYAVIPHQETWASTHAPSGTISNNQGWVYIQGAGDIRSEFPNWVSGMDLRAGGPILQDSGSAYACVEGVYCEGGQGPCYFTANSLVKAPAIGRCLALDGLLYGGVLEGQPEALKTPRSFVIGRTSYGNPYDDARGQVILVGAINEIWRSFNADRTAGWYATGTTDGYTMSDAFSGEQVMVVTGSSGAYAFGRAAGVQGVAFFPKFALGGAGGRIIDVNTAAPTTGSHAAGEIVYNIAPSAGGKVGWVCTAAGTPGSWKAFGAIDA